MALKLRVTSFASQPMGATAEYVFDDSGGSIGRSKSNDWCLPDPDRVISNTHAYIRFVNGEFYFCDNSTNGTSLNTLHLAKGDERALHSGDHLKIGAYDISVEATGQALESGRNNSQRVQPPVDSVIPNANVDPGASLDPLDLIGNGSSGSPVDLPPEGFDFTGPGAEADHVDAESMGFELPSAVPDPSPMPSAEASPGGIPENWDETGFGSSPKPELQPALKPQSAASVGAATAPVATATVNNDQRDNIAALLEAAGVRPESITSETYEALGKILQVVVQGTVDILSARAQIKDQFRVPATVLKPVENNPLKFSINAQDALQNLFGKNNPGFQSPVDAFQESFEDIKAHQMAVIAGMRAAYESMLEYFNPADLEAEFDKALRRGVLGGVMSKSKYWDLYEEMYKSLARDRDSSFHLLFGDEFARAYEEQLQRLSTSRRE